MVKHQYEESYLYYTDEEVLQEPPSSSIYLPESYVVRCRLKETRYLILNDSNRWQNPENVEINIFIDKPLTV